MAMNSEQVARVAKRQWEILTTMAEDPEISLYRITLRHGLPRTTARHIVERLKVLGFVRKDNDQWAITKRGQTFLAEGR